MSATGHYSTVSGYKHVQSTASNTWVINHNMGSNNSKGIPVVDVYVNSGASLQKILPETTDMSVKGQLTLHFSTAYSGFALITA